MSGFKDMLNRDIGNVFLNADEFAEKCTVIYEGEAFRSIAVSLQENADSGRQNRTVQDHAQGLYRKSSSARRRTWAAGIWKRTVLWRSSGYRAASAFQKNSPLPPAPVKWG